MNGKPRHAWSGPDLQEFTDVAISDPAELARIRSRRPRKWPAWSRWLIGAGVLLAVFITGLLLGRFVL